MQNRGALFTLDPHSPNVLAGGKRPFHTIIPAFMEKGDQHIGFGIMGGANQPLAHAQFASNIIDYGMNIQAALEAPRFTKKNSGRLRRIDRRPRARSRRCSSFPNAVTKSVFAANTLRRWGVARLSCTTHARERTTPHPTRAPTAKRSPNRSCLDGVTVKPIRPRQITRPRQARARGKFLPGRGPARR